MSQIGAGRFSRRAHGPALLRLASGAQPVVQLEGICDLDPARPERAAQFQQDFGYRRQFTDIGRMLDETSPDLIVCCVPPRHAANLLRAVLPRGAAVFTEKPPATSAHEAAELASLASRSGALSYVAFNRRRMPAVELAKQWIGTSDRLRRIDASMLRVGRRETDFITMTGVHAIDTLRYLAGTITRVEAVGHRTRYVVGRPGVGRQEAGHNVTASLRFESGVHGSLRIRVDAPVGMERYTLECDESTVDVSICAPYSDDAAWAGVRIYRGARLEQEIAADDDWLETAGILGEHRACLRSMTDGTLPDCSLDEACRSMVMAETIALQVGAGMAGATEGGPYECARG